MEPDISRRELSRRVCSWLDWYSPSGEAQEMSCRKALAELNRKGVVRLPDTKTYGFDKPGKPLCLPDMVCIDCTLDQLGPITVQPIHNSRDQESKIWFALMDSFHYLGAKPLCGAQIRYIVKSPIYGYLGALAFSSGTWALKDRDSFIGWSEAGRRANIQQVVVNDRFLILPTIKVPHLASHVLGTTLNRLADDWQQRYCIRPVVVETFVDPRFYKGICYKAANWVEVGETSGRRDGVKKKIFLYGLCPQYKEILCEAPEYELGQNKRPESPANWAEEEFGTVQFFDDRLKQRLYTIAQDFYGKPMATIPEACGEKARIIGAYRFFQNDKTDMETILTAHTEATIERIKQHSLILVPQDTTTLNYSSHPATVGLGPVNNKDDSCIGLILHDTLAFTEQGTPLGVLDAQCWARDPEEAGKKYKRKELPIEQKESFKWLRSYRKAAQVQRLCPDTTLVCMGDRESDIYDLFMEKEKAEVGPELLVRLEKTRNRKTERGKLWQVMEDEPIAGAIKIHIPRSGSRPSRDAWFNIRYCEVQLQPPVKSSHQPITVWVVSLTEKGIPGAGNKPIEWMLLSTMPVNDLQDAITRVEWYAGRWGIEVYHRTLKSGCRIKDRQLGTASRIEACLGIDMVIAWRIYHLTMLGRETPEVPCTVFFKDIEWKALCVLATGNPEPPEEPPSMSQAIRMLGGIGGHLGRKSDGPPGTQVLWRGLQSLDVAVKVYATMTNQKPPPNEYDYLMRADP